MSKSEARSLTRPFQPEEFWFYKSSFASTRSKGKYLINYVPRNAGKTATINHK
jgi:hypothetical protein